MNEAEMQKKFIQLQMIHQQLQQLQQQIDALTQQEMELALVKENVKELSSIKEGTEILVPIAAGIFAKAKWEGHDKFLINVGLGTTVEKTPEEVNRLVGEQQKEAEKLKAEMSAHMEGLMQQAKSLD